MRSSARWVVVGLAGWGLSACGSDVVGVSPDAATVRASLSGTVATGADLQVTGSSDNGSPFINTAYSYTYQVKNAGPDSAMNVTFADTLLDGSTVTFVMSDVGACVMNTTTVSCNLGTIRKGSQASIKFTVGAFTAELLPNTGIATSTTPDPLPTNNSATVTVKVQSPSTGGGKALPVIVSTYSSLPAVFNGGGYNITGSGEAPGVQFTATQSGAWNGVFASLHGQGLAGRGVCWINADDVNNPDNPGAMIGMTASNAIPATGGTLTFFPAQQTLLPVPIVAGQKYWLFCRGLSNQVWGGLWDFALDFTLTSPFATGAGSLAFAEGTARTPAFQVNVAQ